MCMMSMPADDIATRRAGLERARREYDEDGVCCLRGVVSQRWIERLRDGFLESRAAPSPLSKTWRADAGPGCFFQDVFAWRRVPALRHFALESGIAREVAAILGSAQLRLYSDHVFVRDAGIEKETPWHQDESYCFVAGSQFCSVWLPLDPVGPDECLQLVRGSHRDGRLYSPVEFATKKTYAGAAGAGVPALDPGLGRAASDHILTWNMQLGDCLVFSARTLHGSTALASSGPRRAYVTRWVGDDARYTEQPWTVPALPLPTRLRRGDPFAGELFPLAYAELNESERERL
jgi:ectoine hydroxylase-related dioxygenase (phytanoyl-CoA dioxygenase family)